VTSGGCIHFASNIPANFVDCEFSNCTALGEGGSIFSQLAQIRMERVKISYSSAYRGAALFATSVLITNCTFYQNTASTQGGALEIYDGSISGTLFQENSAPSAGAIDLTASSNMNITNCQFIGNKAVANVSRGAGAIYTESIQSLVINGTVFDSNLSNGNGGAMTMISAQNAVTNFIDVVFRNNVAAQQGGGISVVGGNFSLTNVTFEGNSGRNGGGMVVDGTGNVQAQDVIFQKNTALQGGGIYCISNVSLSVSAVQFLQNGAAICEEDVAGLCAGVFMSCASKEISPTCNDCADKTCVIHNGNAHCFASPKATDGCLCALPPPSPPTEPPSNTGMIVGLVIGAICLVVVIFLACRFCKKTSYRPVG